MGLLSKLKDRREERRLADMLGDFKTYRIEFSDNADRSKTKELKVNPGDVVVTKGVKVRGGAAYILATVIRTGADFRFHIGNTWTSGVITTPEGDYMLVPVVED